MKFDMKQMAPADRYRLLVNTVTPRPIAWVVSRNADGLLNAAPYSFFNVLGSEPPLCVLGIGQRAEGDPKDTARNIVEAGEFTVNLTELPETVPHPVTMKWWEDFPEAYAASRTNQESPEDAMPRYAAWLNDLPARPVFVAHPVAWDFGWIYSYLLRFHGTCPFGHSGLDIKTLAMAALDIPYRNCMKSNFPSSWLDEEDRHTHVALDDAREQGVLFCRALNHLRASQSQVVDPEPVGE